MRGKVLINNQDIMTASPSDIFRFRWKQIFHCNASALNALNPVIHTRQINDVLITHSGLTGGDANDRAEELLSL